MNTKVSTLPFYSNIHKHKYFIFTLYILFGLCIVPLACMATTKGHDYAFHLQRIQALAEEIKMGNIFPRIYTTLLEGNGYASPLFYGDFFLHIPAVLTLCGVSLTDAYAIFVAMIFIATTLSMYFCAFSLTQSTQAAFCASIMYGLSPYLVTDLIQRAAIGEALAFIFIPITFLGFYHISYGTIHKWPLLPIGLAGMLNCHVLSSVTTVIILFIFFVVSYKQYVHKPSRLLYLLISVLFFFLLSANFIFPMLEQMLSNTFLSTEGYSATIFGTLEERAMPLWALFSNTSMIVDSKYIPNGLSITYFVFIYIFLRGEKRFRNKLVAFLLLTYAVTSFITTDLFPWHLFQNIAGIIQFPWRLLVYPTFFLAIAVAIYFSQDNIPHNLNWLMYIVLIVSLCSYISSGFAYFNVYKIFQMESTQLDYSYHNAIGAGEYLPSLSEHDKSTNTYYMHGYKTYLIENADTIYSDGNPQISFSRADGKLIVEFSEMNKDNAYLDVPLLMYTGYSAQLENGTKLDCKYGNHNRIRVNVGNLREGTIIFEYTGTATQKISSIITIFSIMIMLAYLVSMQRSQKSIKTLSEF